MLVAAIACGCSNTLNRKMSKNVYFLTGTLYLAIFLALACIVPVVVWEPAEVTTFGDMELNCALFLAGFAVLAFASHLLMSIALKLEEGRKVSVLKYTQVVYAYIVDYLVFATPVIATDLVGAGLILGTFTVIAICRCAGKIR